MKRGPERKIEENGEREHRDKMIEKKEIMTSKKKRIKNVKQSHQKDDVYRFVKNVKWVMVLHT